MTPDNCRINLQEELELSLQQFALFSHRKACCREDEQASLEIIAADGTIY
jgi:hypothetical protein